MGFNCGIVGLPNVGKSTLFNALTASAAAAAANYPFCTIEPNTGRVAVPDTRLETIAALAKSATVIPTQMEFVDIAGLVRGASKGEGLGNTFLAHIRAVDAIAHVVRCFEDDNVTHVEGGVDPVRDAEIVSTELMLADLDSLERRTDTTAKRARGGDAEAKADLRVMEPALALLREGRPARTAIIADDDRKRFQMLQLITAKPMLYVCNVDEASAVDGNAFTRAVAEMATAERAEVVVVSARIEAELAELTDKEERAAFLAELGIEATGLARFIGAGYRLLDLITYFTAGPKETRAWTIGRGTKAPQAAGVIHSDFERGFICAEVIGYDDFMAEGGEAGAKLQGKLRQEGRDYVVQDGDVVHFRFNV